VPKITGGIDPHRDSCTIGIVDEHGIEIAVAVFDNSGAGHAAAIDFLTSHNVDQVAIEGSASWGRHIALAVVAAGFDAREVPPQRTSSRRRARRQPKTDQVDAVATARALLAEPTLGPVQTLEATDPLLAEIEAVIEHRRALVAIRTQMLHFIADQLAKLPTEIRDQLGVAGKVETRLRRLERIELSTDSPAGGYRLGWLTDHIDRDRQMRREIRQLETVLDEMLDRHGTSLRDEPGIGTISAATLLVEIGDPTRFATESKFARWCGAGAVAMSSGEGTGQPVAHRVDWNGNRRVNSILHVASVTQQRDLPEARAFVDRKIAEGKTRRMARRSHKRQLANRIIRRMWKDHRRLNAEPIPAAA
jgi:transposase